MPRTKPLALLLGLRLRDPAADAARRTAEAFLREVERLQPALPLAWNLPLAALEAAGRAELAARIKSRVRDGSDSVLLMGYEGAPHPLLGAEELEKELDWCRRNPWGPGARTLPGWEPRHLLPLAADLQRERQDGVYARHGFLSVGLAEPLQQALARLARTGRPGRTAYRFPARRLAGRSALYPALVPALGFDEPPAGRAQRPLLLAAEMAGAQPLFLLLDPLGEPGQAAPEPRPLLAALLQELETRYRLEFPTLEQALAAGPEASEPGPDPDPDALPLLSPSAMEACTRAEALRSRSRRRSDAELRAVLQVLGHRPAHPRAGARGKERRPEPTLVAAMSGLVTLQGDGLAATFEDGRLSGLERAGTWTLGAGPADSYLIAAGRRLPLEPESAFSFEQGQDSGLRSVLKAGLEGRQVELVIQACFREGREDLELDFRLRFPELPPALELQGVVPLELPVFALGPGTRAAVAGELAGGGSFSTALEPEQGARLFTGSRLSLRREGGGPAIVFRPGAPSGVLVLGVRVIRLRRGLHLLASPFGARFHAPAGLYSGSSLGFRLRLGLEE